MEKTCLSKLITGLKRFKQQPGDCSYAAVASVGNFYDKRIDYDFICSITESDGQGMYTPEICELLNKIGFTSVQVVTADINQFDFKWKDFSKKQIIDQFKKQARRHPEVTYKEVSKIFARWLSSKDNNSIVLDMHFGEHIRQHILSDTPVLASFNWNLFFGFPKWNEKGEHDPIKGESEEHEVVLYGFNDKNVKVLDSHHEYYKRRLKKYAKGRYQIGWETLMTVMSCGDLIIPTDFCPERLDELVYKNKNS